MRLGRVYVMGSVVDLDNAEMVEHAKNALCDDLCEAVKMGDEESLITTDEDPTLKEEAIPEFLRVEDDLAD